MYITYTIFDNFKTFVMRINCNENKDSAFNENFDFDIKIYGSINTIYNIPVENWDTTPSFNDRTV